MDSSSSIPQSSITLLHRWSPLFIYHSFPSFQMLFCVRSPLTLFSLTLWHQCINIVQSTSCQFFCCNISSFVSWCFHHNNDLLRCSSIGSHSMQSLVRDFRPASMVRSPPVNNSSWNIPHAVFYPWLDSKHVRPVVQQRCSKPMACVKVVFREEDRKIMDMVHSLSVGHEGEIVASADLSFHPDDSTLMMVITNLWKGVLRLIEEKQTCSLSLRNRTSIRMSAAGRQWQSILMHEHRSHAAIVLGLVHDGGYNDFARKDRVLDRRRTGVYSREPVTINPSTIRCESAHIV